MVPKVISYEVYTSSLDGAKAILADVTDAAFWVCSCYKRLRGVAGRENWGSEDLRSSPRFAASQFPNLGFLLIKLCSTDTGKFSMNLCFFFFFPESHFKNSVDSYSSRKTTTKALLRAFSFNPFLSETDVQSLPSALSLGEIKFPSPAVTFMYTIDSRNRGWIFKDGLIFIWKKKSLLYNIKSGTAYMATNQGTPDSK